MSGFKELDTGSAFFLLSAYSVLDKQGRGQRCEREYGFFFTLLFFVLREEEYDYGLCADKAVYILCLLQLLCAAHHW